MRLDLRRYVLVSLLWLCSSQKGGHAVGLDWERRFADESETPSTKAEKFFVNRTPLSEGSAAFFNSSGVNWAMLDNVCFVPPSKVLLFRKEGRKPIFPPGWRGMRPWKFHGFGWGWEFKETTVKDPAAALQASGSLFVPRSSPDTKGLSGNGTWIAVPPFQNHLFHVAEGVLTSFHVAMHPEEFPPMNLLIQCGSSIRDMKNVKAFWDFATGPLLRNDTNGTTPRSVRTGRGSPEERAAVLPARYSRVCFERLNLLGRMMYPDMGGMFASIEAARVFRQRAYSHFNVRLLPPPERALRVFVLRRPPNASHGRTFTNEQAIFRVLYRLGMNPHYVDHPDLGRPERVSLGQTVSWLANADILITPHGNGLVNLLWMQENSGVLEIVPYAFRQAVYNVKAGTAGLLYDWMESSVPVKKPPGCLSHLTEWANAYDKLGARCNSAMNGGKITIDTDALESRLRMLAGNVVARKYQLSGKRALRLALPRVALGLENKETYERQYLRECCDKPEPLLVGSGTR